MAPIAASATTASSKAAPCWLDTVFSLCIAKPDVGAETLRHDDRCHGYSCGDRAVGYAAHGQADQTYLGRQRGRQSARVEKPKPQAVGGEWTEDRLYLALSAAHRPAPQPVLTA